ncbi:MAG TPA: insulinase family protein, partial [Bacillota bacterium]
MTLDPLGFTHHTLADGVELFIRPTRRFRRMTVAVFWEQQLAADLASLTALLPRVLIRGTRSFPLTLALERRQAELYGAELDAGVFKLGERHVASLAIELPAERYAGDPDLLRQAVALLAEAAQRPALSDG